MEVWSNADVMNGNQKENCADFRAAAIIVVSINLQMFFPKSFLHVRISRVSGG